MWGLFNYLWENAVQASVGMQQCALGNLWTADCWRAGETLHLEGGEMADGKREPAGERYEGQGEKRWTKENMEGRWKNCKFEKEGDDREKKKRKNREAVMARCRWWKQRKRQRRRKVCRVKFKNTAFKKTKEEERWVKMEDRGKTRVGAKKYIYVRKLKKGDEKGIWTKWWGGQWGAEHTE